MRYEAQQNHKRKTIVSVVDLQALNSWETEIVTVFDHGQKKRKKSDLIVNSLNLYNDLSKISSKTPKQKILDIINKYK